jgi:hypothetical protein
MNWPRQEGYVPASESRTQARTWKNNLGWVLIFWEVRGKSIGGDLDVDDEGFE